MKKALAGMPSHLELVEKIQLGVDPIDYVSINTPPICNYRCKKCFTWANRNPTQDYIGTPKLLDLLTRAKEKGAKVVGLLGEGEPTLFQDFKKIIKHISDLEMTTVLASNGSVFSQELTDFCYDHMVSPAVSLDTLDENEYKSNCGGAADLNKLKKNLEYVRKKYSGAIIEKHGVRVYRFAIHTTVHNDNFNNIESIVHFCGNDIYFSCEHIAKVGIANENPEIYGGGQDFKIYDNIRKKAHSVMKPMVIVNKRNSTPAACCFFYYGISISYNGEIMLDTHAVETKNQIGNINDYDNFDDIINASNRLKKVFYKKYGCNYCLIRDENYPKFIEDLKNGGRRDPIDWTA